MIPQHVVIVGSSGAVGRLFVRTLADAATTLTGIDIARPAASHGLDAFVLADIAAPPSAALQAVACADWIVVCLPETAALAALRMIAATLPAGALWVDTLSIKERICEALRAATRIEALSINPLFAPDLGFQGQNVAVVPARTGPRARVFLERLTSAGGRPITLSATDHDRHTGIIQVATHALVLSLGMMLEKESYDIDMALQLSTPPHRLLLALLNRITSGDPLLYWEIQHQHPLAPHFRASLGDALERLDRLVADGSVAQFADEFTRIRSRLDGATKKLASLTRSAVEAMSDPVRHRP